MHGDGVVGDDDGVDDGGNGVDVDAVQLANVQYRVAGRELEPIASMQAHVITHGNTHIDSYHVLEYEKNLEKNLKKWLTPPPYRLKITFSVPVTGTFFTYLAEYVSISWRARVTSGASSSPSSGSSLPLVMRNK